MKKMRLKKSVIIITIVIAVVAIGLAAANLLLFETGQNEDAKYVAGEDAFYRRVPLRKWDRGVLNTFPSIDKKSDG